MISISKMIEEIYEVMNKVLTEWEINFMKSIAKQYKDERRNLSEKQYKILVRLYEKVCDSPY